MPLRLVVSRGKDPQPGQLEACGQEMRHCQSVGHRIGGGACSIEGMQGQVQLFQKARPPLLAAAPAKQASSGARQEGRGGGASGLGDNSQGAGEVPVAQEELCHEETEGPESAGSVYFRSGW